MTTPTAAATPEELAAKLRADQDAIDDLAQSLRGAGIKHIRKVLAAIREAQAAQIAELTAESERLKEALESDDDMLLRELSVVSQDYVDMKARATQAEAALSASQERERVMREALTSDVVAAALQEAWDDFCADANAFPHCFTILPGKRLMANFQISNFASFVALALTAAIQPKEPANG